MRRTKAPSKIGCPSLIDNVSYRKESHQYKEPPKIEVSDTNYFSIAYGKPSKKKHKTWEGDGYIVVDERTVKLLDEDCKPMGIIPRRQLSRPTWENGESFIIAGKYVEILDRVYGLPGVCKDANTVRINDDLSAEHSKPAKICRVDGGDGSKIHSNSEFKPVILRPPSEKVLLSKVEDKAVILARPPAHHIFEYNDTCGAINEVRLDPILAQRMRLHQLEGVRFLYECVMGFRGRGHGAILADEMGLGKSVQTIALIWTLLKQNPYGSDGVISKCLIVCPSSLVLNWRNEFEKWLPGNRIRVFCVSGDQKVEHYSSANGGPIMILSYEMMSRHWLLLHDLKFGLLVCDEAHRLKNSNTKAVTHIESLAVLRRVLLTGTPIQNELGELHTLARLCVPSVSLSIASTGDLDDRDNFMRRFSGLHRQPEDDSDNCELAALQRVTKSFMLRRTNSINLRFLPPRADFIIFCRPTKLQLALYNVVLDCRSRLLFGGNGVAALACVHLLRKICACPRLLLRYLESSAVANKENQNDQDAEEDTSYADLAKEVQRELKAQCREDSDLRRAISSLGTGNDSTDVQSGKMAVITQMLECLGPGDKMVVASHFTETLDMLQSLCARLCVVTTRIDGATPVVRRASIVERFNNQPADRPEVMLLSCRAGGEGLNLVGAGRILLYDLDWNPATDAQTMARVWRDGQQHARVSVYRLVTSGTLEESILQRQVCKQGLSSAVVDPSGGNDNKQRQQHFTEAELKDVFTLHQFKDGEGSWTHSLLGCLCTCTVNNAPTEPVPVLDNGRCQLGLMATQQEDKSANAAELISWDHWLNPETVYTHALSVDPLIAISAHHIDSVFTRTTHQDPQLTNDPSGNSLL